jgi:hypothetical protein
MDQRSALPVLPATFAATRESLRALACYVVAPARKADSGRIGLRALEDGFGTPPLGDGSQVVVRGVLIGRRPGAMIPLTSLRAAAQHIGIDLTPHPGVGSDIPPFDPDADLAVEEQASLALGTWYRFAQNALDSLTADVSATQSQLWPEHFDLATTVTLGGDRRVNVGFSPGDGFEPGPYVYVGPHDTSDLHDPFWNAPFGAVLRYADLLDVLDPINRSLGFIRTALGLLRS